MREGVYVENLTESEVGCVSDIVNLLIRVSAFPLEFSFLLMNVLW
jgi:hypothetical protein